MWIKSVALTNVKSFRGRTEVYFSSKANFLVGPNAGGKSNLLEIINWVLRRYFLKAYQVRPIPQDGFFAKDIIHVQNPRQLEKYRGLKGEESCVEITMVVHESDVHNMNAIRGHRADLEAALSKYRNKPVLNLRLVDNWNTSLFAGNEEVSFTLSDEELKRGSLEVTKLGSRERVFYEYLSHLELFLILAKDVTDIDIRPVLFYMPPYRGASGEDVRARLGQDNYYELLTKAFSVDAHTTMTPLKLATVRFGIKHRRYEYQARERGYGKDWENDPEVSLVSDQLERIGYKWEPKLIDETVYEISLHDQSGELLITQASSGEIELVSFVLGVLGYGLRGGVLLIDEPELHLHPRWQGLMRNALVELAEQNQTQIIAATHSPSFITPETLPYVHRVARDESGATHVYSFGEQDDEEPRALLHIVKSFNNERMFFADRVILVEGISDRLLFDALVRYLTPESNSPEVVEVLDVGGKHNFDKYRSFLDRMKVPTAIIADLDYAYDLNKDELADLFETDYRKVYEKVLNDKQSKDRASLAEQLDRAIQTGDCERLREVWEYIKSRHRVLRKDLTDEQRRRLEEVIEEQKQNNIFILRRGKIEDYLPKENRSLDGIIDLTKEENFTAWVEDPSNEGARELLKIVREILRLDPHPPGIQQPTGGSKLAKT